MYSKYIYTNALEHEDLIFFTFSFYIFFFFLVTTKRKTQQDSSALPQIGRLKVIVVGLQI